MALSLDIVRRSSFKTSPWKNGGGVTHEALRVPAAGDPYRWRVSVAEIDQSGPFSDFAGYWRTMVLLRGLGVTLEFGDGRQRSLRTVGDMAQFDGAVPTQCRLLNGPCTDLNLMVANEARVQARVEALAGPIDVQAAPLETTLIFSIESGLRLEGGGGEVAHLEPWDLALLSAGRVRARAAPAGAGATPRPVFFATISS